MTYHDILEKVKQEVRVQHVSDEVTNAASYMLFRTGTENILIAVADDYNHSLHVVYDPYETLGCNSTTDETVPDVRFAKIGIDDNNRNIVKLTNGERAIIDSSGIIRAS